MIERIVSGGQTGVDRAALDAALAAGLPVGGWCPRGRRAEDGSLADRYPLRETPSARYAQRTRWNVRDSDGTLILLLSDAPDTSGGTALTAKAARKLGRPLRVETLGSGADPEAVRRWLRAHAVRVLNVAGPRAGEADGVYQAARVFLAALLLEDGE